MAIWGRLVAVFWGIFFLLSKQNGRLISEDGLSVSRLF
jgi:hypothetical protein